MRISHKIMTGGLDAFLSRGIVSQPYIDEVYKIFPSGPIINIDSFAHEVDEFGAEQTIYRKMCVPFPRFSMEYEYKGMPFNQGLVIFEHYDGHSSAVNLIEEDINQLIEKNNIPPSSSFSILIGHCFATTRLLSHVMPVCLIITAIDENGTNYPFAITVGKLEKIVQRGAHSRSAINQAYADAMCGVCACMSAMQVLGSGGSIADAGCPQPKHRILRQAKKRMKQPSFGWRHHTIVVKPNNSSKAKDVYIDLNDEESMAPYHCVRAHYATYTKEKPLFGKYVGRFYVPAHFRGDPKNGYVSKDYRILSHHDPTT